MVKIAFYTPQIDCRGTCVALYDYAEKNVDILGNESIIIVPKSSLTSGVNEKTAVDKFIKKFIVFYFGKSQLDEVLLDQKCDILYTIKYGHRDNIFSNRVKTIVHCVFDLSQPHGNVYAGVSSTIAKKYGSELYVPHMINFFQGDPTDNLRNVLGVTSEGIVFGRYGGSDTFDLRFTHGVISRILNERKDVYFLFMNTPRFVEHPRVFYLEKNSDIDFKRRFVNTCDAHLECGRLGHTFGLSIAEFSVCNKPIIAYNGGDVWNRAHIDILGDKGLYYKDETEFYDILNTFDPMEYVDKDMNCYREFSPENVMVKFKEVFID